MSDAKKQLTLNEDQTMMLLRYIAKAQEDLDDATARLREINMMLAHELYGLPYDPEFSLREQLDKKDQQQS